MPGQLTMQALRRKMGTWTAGSRWLGSTLLLSQLIACGETAPNDPLRKRHGTLVIEGCTLDAAQRQTVETDALRSVISTAILICPAIREGAVSPQETDAVQAMTSTISLLRGRGLRVELAITARDELGQELTAPRLAALLRDPTQRDLTTAGAAQFSARADGLVVALPSLPASSESDFTAWVKALAALTPGRKPSIFVPPSSSEPSDLPDGSAVNLYSLASTVRNVYAMTLDYSCCEGRPGPTTEIGWSAAVATLAAKQSGQTAVHLAQPLYGTHFIDGASQPLSYLAAAGLASAQHVQVLRRDDRSLQFSFIDAQSQRNEVWFDDGQSIAHRLYLLDKFLSTDVGVLYYGLGGEDPNLWSTLQGRMK